MCAIVEEYAAEREIESAKKAILKGFRGGVLTKKGASIMYPRMKPFEIEALYQEVKKPARGRRPAKCS